LFCLARRALSFGFQEGGPSGGLHGNGVGGALYDVAFVQVDELGLVVQQFRFAVAAVGADDDAVADGGLVGGGAVHRDDARAVFGADGVGGEAFAIGDVVDLDLLVFADAGQVKQLAVDGAGAFVVQFRVGHA